MTVSNQIAKSTVRIVCRRDDKISVGTSFYHSLKLSDGREAPVLITNRHVVRGFKELKLTFSKAEDVLKATEDDIVTFHWDDLQSIVCYHPNNEIDLALVFLEPILRSANAGNVALTVIDEQNFINAELENALSFAENVLVVGYPQGFWDSKKNLPLFRRGITSTPCMLDYEGKPQILIDCSIYPGSSGSPVFLFNHPTYVEGNQLKFGTQFALLGIVSAVLIYGANGEVIQESVPTKIGDKAVSHIPNNLGVVIKAREITTLLEAVRNRISDNEKAERRAVTGNSPTFNVRF